MSIISSIVSAINRALTPRIPRISSGLGNILSRATQWGMKKVGFSIRDIVDTIQHSDIETIADKLHQSTFTVARLLDTEPYVLASDKTKLLPRNLLVSGTLKSASNYRYFYTADMLDKNGNLVTRKWFSMYANTQKAFSEVEQDIEDSISGTYDPGFYLANLSFHHVIHQRGAPFIPVNPR